jgi:tRNA threonylcarbamoyladenosine biosynthesis protein TsaE
LLTLTHPPILESRSLHWPDEAACARLAATWALRPALQHASIVLAGDLGAGKTTLVRHLLQALGVRGRIKSPTYAVVEPYTITPAGAPAWPAWHFDFYRFADPREWEDAGLRELFTGPGLKLSEWPQRVAGVLPTPDLQVHIALLDDAQRELRLDAYTPRGQELLP